MREVKRVPLDFEWPLRKRWEGYVKPPALVASPCPDCDCGYSSYADALHDLWYGHVPSDPETTSSTPFSADHPAVHARAAFNIASAPAFYGTGETAIAREARRLVEIFNGAWCHHLSQDDVDALIAHDRLFDFTHTLDPQTRRWQRKDPPVRPTAMQVNEWSLRGSGHDSFNAHIVITARCAREGKPAYCATCQGDGTVESYAGQRIMSEAWERTDPPTGEGWQLWECTSEGSPVSAVFDSAESLAQWLTTPDGGRQLGNDRPLTIRQARRFVGIGYAPTGYIDGGGIHNGPEYVATQSLLDELDESDRDSPSPHR